MEDWWMYCSNQGCKNHVGEPYGQHNTPEFLEMENPAAGTPDPAIDPYIDLLKVFG